MGDFMALEDYLAHYIQWNGDGCENITSEIIREAIRDYEKEYLVRVNVE